MILNGVKTTLLESVAASLPMGAIWGGIALVAGVSAAPAVAGAAIATTVLVASRNAYGFIRDALFKSRVEDLEQHAKSLGLNVADIRVKCKTDQLGDEFGHERPRVLSHLINDKELAQWANETGTTTDHYRISREAVSEAKESMRIMAAQRNTLTSALPVHHTLVAASLVMGGIGASKESRPGFFAEGRQQGIQDSEDDAPAFRMRP